MFSSLRRTPLAQRALGALDLARSFLLLEDDYAVDWEVDRGRAVRQDLTRTGSRCAGGTQTRRPGTVPAARQECISPTVSGRPATRGIAEATRESEFRARRGARAARPETRAARSDPCDR